MKTMLRGFIVGTSTFALSACGAVPSPVSPSSIPTASTIPTAEISTTTLAPSSLAVNSEVLEFAFPSSPLVTLSEKKTFSIRQGFALDMLVSNAASCETNLTKEHFATVLKTYAPTDVATEYHFAYNAASQDPHEWVITVMANKLHYVDLKAFERDFGVCDAGVSRYPSKVNDAYLMFMSSCGSGFSDTSGLPNGCQKVREILEPNIEFNPSVKSSSLASTKTPSSSIVSSQPVYTNAEYGFSLDFGTWGTVTIGDAVGRYKDIMPVKAVFDFVASKDRERQVTIFVVALAAQDDDAIVDAPMTLLKKNDKYAFYYTSSGDNAGALGMEDAKWDTVYQESKQIVKTFKLL